jgi:peptidase S51-like protein
VIFCESMKSIFEKGGGRYLYCYNLVMTTTYILAGGNDRATEGYGERLGQEIAKRVSSPRILSCFFSWPVESWESKSHDWRSWFEKYFGEAITYDYAKKEMFLRQIDSADVIYLHGGTTQLLFDTLPPADSLKKHFEGKTVVGSSAGANILAKNYWSSKRAVPAHGLAIVDINIMVHYGTLGHEGTTRTPDDWIKEERDFQKFIGREVITRLPEGQFVVRQALD